MTKLILDFYVENFSTCNTSGHSSSISINKSHNQNINRNNLELEQIILNRLLSRNSQSNSTNEDELKQFDEFANIYYDLQEHERQSQYLDKILIQSQFSRLKELYPVLYTGANDIANGIDSSSASTDQNNSNNANNSNNPFFIIENELKQLQSEMKLYESSSSKKLLIIMLRLLKYYKVFVDFCFIFLFNNFFDLETVQFIA